jgi:adenosine kinase
MAVLVSGSVAIDHIMVYRGRFKDVILPDRVHALNVSFHVPELRRTFGGCAANIAYHLRALGGDPLVLATVGGDFDAYAAWLDRCGVRRDFIRELPGEVTAGAYITTDLDDNQITGFHPGAMERAHELRIEDVAEPVELGIVSPNGKRAMLEHARALKRRGVATVVDPGQGLPRLARGELLEMIEGAAVYVVNDYEWSLTVERTGLAEDAIVSLAGAVIVTLGERGSLLRRNGASEERIPPARAERVVDPTGAGDAYRAGLLFGMARGLALETAARIGSLLGALAVEHPGTQTMPLDPDGLRSRFERELGDAL